MDGETPATPAENSNEEYSKKDKKKRKKKNKKRKKGDSEDEEDEKTSKDEDKKNQMIIKDLIVDNFVLLHLIGQGAFGQIYISYNMRDNCQVSIKKEVKRPPKTPQLRTESKVYQALLDINVDDLSGAKQFSQSTVEGVPKFYGVGEYGDSYYMIIDFLGPNLIELFNYCGCKKFTVSTVCLIALQMLNRIEYLHKHHYLHRDIKPENFLIGMQEKSNVIYLIDFGLSKKYKNPKTHQHIPYREGRSLTGTARYVSINTHLGIEQSRRDDLESIGYVLVFFLKGSLPWQGLKNGNDKYLRIMEKKLQIPTEILCYGLPDEIIYYLNYCKSLRFEDRPDYDYLRGLFIKLLATCNSVYGLTKDLLKFDWCFEDPANTIWQVFTKKPNAKALNQSMNSSFGNKEGGNENHEISLKKDSHKKLSNDNIYKKQLSNIEEVKGDLKTNENNPNYEPSEDDSSASEKKNKKADDANKINSIKEEDAKQIKEEEEEEDTLREGFKLQDLGPGQLNEDLKEVFTYNENKQENIDIYIDKLYNAKPPKKENKDILIENDKPVEKVSDENSDKKDLISSDKNNDNKNVEKSVKDIVNKESELIESSNGDNSKKKKGSLKNSNLIISENERTEQRTLNAPVRNSKNYSNDMVNKVNEMNTDQDKLKFKQIDVEQKQNAVDIVGKDNTKEAASKDISKENSKDTKENKISEDKEEKKDAKTTSNKEVKKNLKSAQSQKEPDKKVSTEEKGRKKTKKQTYKSVNITPSGETPDGETPGNEIPGALTQNPVKVSKEHLIKISTDPVANFYSVIKDLGHGSYGQVKKVKHKELSEVRAMKITNKKSDSSKYEIEILRKISHPNITNIFEIFADSKKYYVIMEFLEGGELFEAITSIGSFTEASACKVMRQVLHAVYYLHSNNIVHRDLKPENIMLTTKPKNGNYQIKLIDFGTAKIFKPGHRMNKFIGTSYYIAPEVLKENYDEKCDVWSCGVILYILLCGYPPFNGNTNVDIFHAIQNQNPIFGGEEWEDITPEAKELIKVMLRKNPNERWTAEMCLKHKWFRLLDDSKRDTRNFKQIQMNAINHMSEFVNQNRFKQAVLQFISTQFNIQKEEGDLREVFKAMDTSNTGQLSGKDFSNKLCELYGENDGRAMAETIFKNLDLDGSGKISYDEFLASMISSKKIVTEERLQKAFKMFDKDNSGKLSISEIKTVFGGTEKQWKKVIEEVDLNNDGEVDYNEFKVMMQNMDKNSIIEKRKYRQETEKSKDMSVGGSE